MPKITSYTFLGPLAYSDRLLGVFGGATNGVSLQQFRDFFGVGTNILTVATYPADPTDAALGKNGDYILTRDTNRLYQRAAGTFPAESQPTATLQGTRVDDEKISRTTSWSSEKIDQYVRGAVAAVFNFRAGDAVRIMPFFAKVLLESLRVAQGTDSFAMRLLLADGTLISSTSGTGAACIGQLSAAIVGLSAAQVAAGYVVEVTYTGTGTGVALLRTIPL